MDYSRGQYPQDRNNDMADRFPILAFQDRRGHSRGASIVFFFFEKAFFDSLFSNRIALDLSPFYFMRGESSGNIVIVTIILITMLGVTLFITWFRGWRDDVY